jgi:hypothetical protein
MREDKLVKASVMYPAARLNNKVATSLAIARFQPINPTLNVNISGSIEGEAIQKDMIGARGTPLKSKPAMIGTTVQEQNGLNAPTRVATRIATPTLAENACLITLSSFRTRMNTLRIILIRNQGQTCQIARAINCPI